MQKLENLSKRLHTHVQDVIEGLLLRSFFGCGWTHNVPGDRNKSLPIEDHYGKKTVHGSPYDPGKHGDIQIFFEDNAVFSAGEIGLNSQATVKHVHPQDLSAGGYSAVGPVEFILVE